MPFLALLFLAWPFLEIAGFIVVGRAIGVFATLALVLVSIALGVTILRGLGFAAVGRLRAEFDRGRHPGETLGHSALIAVAALLLIVPGFLSDVVALVLLLPPVRTVLIRAVAARANVVVVRTETRRSAGVVDLEEGDWRRSEPGAGGSAPAPRRLDDRRAGEDHSDRPAGDHPGEAGGPRTRDAREP